MLTTLIISVVIALVLAIVNFFANGSLELAIDTFLTFINQAFEMIQSLIDKWF